MKRLRQLPNGPAEDRGAALILALILVTVIGVGGAALLTFSDTSIRTTVALRDQAGKAYSADGAGQVAINSLLTGHGFDTPELFTNADGTTCFGDLGGIQNLPDFYPATNGREGTVPSSASVECSVDPETGENATDVPIDDTNRPQQAILTLGPPRAGEDGINVKALGSPGNFEVRGKVKSNSNINVQNGTLTSNAAVTAVGACSGTIISTPSANCNAPTSVTADPDYERARARPASEATAVPAYQSVPADIPASCPGGVVTFDPGYYDNAVALTALMTGNGDCGGSTWWFKPGTYYFDFHNNRNHSDVYHGAETLNNDSADQWRITRGNLVAGTPADSNGNAIASPGASPAIPGSCQSPARSTTADGGVQFIFGGDSQLALGGSAKAEICGSYNEVQPDEERPPIAIYGVKVGTATTTTLTGPGPGADARLKMSLPVPTQTTNFVDRARIMEEGESDGLSTWVKTTPTPATETVTVSGYAPPSGSAVPPGSIVKAATVRVRHGNSQGYTTTGNPANRDSVVIAFTPKGETGSPTATAITLTPEDLSSGTGLETDELDLYGVGPSAGTSDFVKYVHDNGFTGADIAYTATLNHPGDESLDTIQVAITYVTPAFRAENNTTVDSNCIAQTYTGVGGGCAVLSTLPGFSGSLYVQGTIYTPIAAIDLTLNNATQQVLRFGVISRSLRVKKTGSFIYSGPLIEIPKDTVGGDGDPIVFLTVWVCPAKSTPSCRTDSSAVAALRIKARIEDSAATPSTREMTILGWSNLR